MNPDTIGCVWTGEFDLNTQRVDGEIFESGKKKLRIKKYPDTCSRGPRRIENCYVCVSSHFEIWTYSENVSILERHLEPLGKSLKSFAKTRVAPVCSPGESNSLYRRLCASWCSVLLPVYYSRLHVACFSGSY